MAESKPAGPATPTPEGPQPQIDLALRQLLKQIVSVSAIPCGKHAEHELDGGIVYYCPWCEADQLVDEDHPFRFDRMLHLAQCPAQRLRHRLDDAPTLASGPAVSPQPHTRVQRDVVMTAIRGCCRTDRVGLTEREIDALTQAIVDAYGPTAVSPQPEPPKVGHIRIRCDFGPLYSFTIEDDLAGSISRWNEIQRAIHATLEPTASQPPAVPEQDALTTLADVDMKGLIAFLEAKAREQQKAADRATEVSSQATYEEVAYSFEQCANALKAVEAMLRREPPAKP